MENRIKALEDKVEKLEKIIEELIKEKSRVKYNEFVGIEIKDFFCNGFFGSREYDLEGAMIIENTDKILTVRKRNGQIAQANLEGWDMREHINEWTTEKVKED